MKHRYKIQIGEWVNVYSTQTLIIDTDDTLDNMTAEQIADYIDNSNALQSKVEIIKEDFDWTTEEHEKWDTNGEVEILEKIENKGGGDDTKRDR